MSIFIFYSVNNGLSKIDECVGSYGRNMLFVIFPHFTTVENIVWHIFLPPVGYVLKTEKANK